MYGLMRRWSKTRTSRGVPEANSPRISAFFEDESNSEFVLWTKNRKAGTKPASAERAVTREEQKSNSFGSLKRTLQDQPFFEDESNSEFVLWTIYSI
jgi:hypothetical protein